MESGQRKGHAEHRNKHREFFKEHDKISGFGIQSRLFYCPVKMTKIFVKTVDNFSCQ